MTIISTRQVSPSEHPAQLDGMAKLSGVRWTVVGVTAQPHPPHLN